MNFNAPTRSAVQVPPREPGCLGEMLTAIVRSFQLAQENQTRSRDEWDRARTEAAAEWRRDQ